MVHCRIINKGEKTAVFQCFPIRVPACSRLHSLANVSARKIHCFSPFYKGTGCRETGSPLYKRRPISPRTLSASGLFLCFPGCWKVFVSTVVKEGKWTSGGRFFTRFRLY
ncbi:hypothetical protein ETC05_04040 [Geobacillus sp. BMUD]|nr:hypothetical protein [Geobacillus sp. BMUD]